MDDLLCWLAVLMTPALSNKTFCNDGNVYICALQYYSHEWHMFTEYFKCG